MISFISAPCAIALYALANIAVFFLYAIDKKRAGTGAWRISEPTLLLAALIGPFGAYGAMRLFRHKTQKVIFWLVPVFLILHSAGMLYIAARVFHVIT